MIGCIDGIFGCLGITVVMEMFGVIILGIMAIEVVIVVVILLWWCW